MIDQEKASEEALRQAQRAKAASLKSIVSQAQAPIAKIKELNSKILQAAACAATAKSIPGMLDGALSTMAAVGQSLQSGLKINGQPVGANTVSSAQSIKGEISSSVESMISTIRGYCSKKKAEAEKERAKALKLKEQFNSVLASYPSSLGPYGPAPTFPEIPEVKDANI